MMESIAQQAAKDARDVFSDDRQAQTAISYMEQLVYAALRNVEYDLTDPVTVHANMLRGTIAKPTVEQIVHLYGREAFQPMIDVAIAKALEKACLAVSEHADWPEDEHGRTEQVDLFARVINAIREITPAVTPAPDAAAIREAWGKAYWRMRSYAIHDNDCKLNKPPHFNGPCSCGLTAALEEALALIPKGGNGRRVYMGQIMAECDCPREAECQAAGRCIAEGRR